MKINFKKYWRKSSLKKPEDGNFLLNHIKLLKPKNFLEIGVYHGVTSRNVCELLNFIHKGNFTFTGIDLFLNDSEISADEYKPTNKFSNPFKEIYFKYILRINPYSIESVSKLLKKFKNNIEIMQGNSNEVLKKIDVTKYDYVFLDGGHKYETVKKDLQLLKNVLNNNGLILCDDYNLTYAPGVKKAIDEFSKENDFGLKIINSRFAEITKSK